MLEKLGCKRLEKEQALVWIKEKNIFYLNTRQSKENDDVNYLWYGPKIEIIKKYRQKSKEEKLNFFMVFGMFLAHYKTDKYYAFCIPINVLEEDKVLDNAIRKGSQNETADNINLTIEWQDGLSPNNFILSLCNTDKKFALAKYDLYDENSFSLFKQKLRDSQSIKMIPGKQKVSDSLVKNDRKKQEASKLDRVINELQREFSKESIANIRYSVEREVNYERNHDKIVNKLDEVLRQKGLTLRYTKEKDLFIKEGNKITKVFEIKTSSDSSSLQKGIGQLILYTLNLDEEPSLFLVLPEAIESSKQKKLKEQLNIDILLFDMKEEDITFVDLDHKVFPENLKE